MICSSGTNVRFLFGIRTNKSLLRIVSIVLILGYKLRVTSYKLRVNRIQADRSKLFLLAAKAIPLVPLST